VARAAFKDIWLDHGRPQRPKVTGAGIVVIVHDLSPL